MLDDMLILQHIKTSEFRICLKELFADQHDPVTVSYTVLAGVLVNDKKKKKFLCEDLLMPSKLW